MTNKKTAIPGLEGLDPQTISAMIQEVELEKMVNAYRPHEQAMRRIVLVGEDAPMTNTHLDRHYEKHRLRMAEEEGEARARAEFKTRQELEADHQKELQATAVTEPPPAPAAAIESIADRNARWLAILDQEERSKPKGAQARTCERVFKQEGIKPDSVKAALQRAKEKRAERIRQGGAIPLSKKKSKAVKVATSAFNWPGPKKT